MSKQKNRQKFFSIKMKTIVIMTFYYKQQLNKKYISIYFYINIKTIYIVYFYAIYIHIYICMYTCSIKYV